MAPEVRPAPISIADRGGRIGTTVYLLIVILIADAEGPGGGQVHGSAALIYLAILGTASIGLLSRAWLMGTRFDDHGIRVRKYFSTRRFGWPEVSHFADGGWINDGDDQRWVLDIVLRDGRTVTTGATSSGKTARPRQLAAIRQAAARYGIPAELTGEAVTEERPVGLHPDPGGQPGLRRHRVVAVAPARSRPRRTLRESGARRGVVAAAGDGGAVARRRFPGQAGRGLVRRHFCPGRHHSGLGRPAGLAGRHGRHFRYCLFGGGICAERRRGVAGHGAVLPEDRPGEPGGGRECRPRGTAGPAHALIMAGHGFGGPGGGDGAWQQGVGTR